MPEILLNKPHDEQLRVRAEAKRFNVLACGRRWGKTSDGIQLALVPALEGLPAGWFAPTYKFLEEVWNDFVDILQPLGTRADCHKSERVIKLWTGGRIDFWSLERPHAGRGRKYARAIVDEAAIVRDLENQWNKAIRPTLTDYRGDAWFYSTPFGMNGFHRLWTKGQSGEPEWASWQMPTSCNPHIPAEEIEAARLDMPADAFSQEYLAEFLADAANPFGLDAIRASCVEGLAAGPVSYWGVDLAKSHDWTVAIGLNDAGDVCAFQRWQSDWRNTMARVAAMIGSTPALVDATGVGDPIVEQLQARCGAVQGYKFTRQSKQQLMEGLAVAIQSGRTSFPDGPIRHELEVFQYEYTPTGVRYAAPEGMHDDCVDALALAMYCMTSLPPAARLTGLGVDEPEYDGVDGWCVPNNEAIWS